MPRYFPQKKKPFGNLIVLTIGLIIVVYFYNKFSAGNIVKQILNIFENSGTKYSKLVEFSEEARDSVKKVMTGFWTYTSDTNGPLVIDDRIELKGNGYIWQVELVRYTLPSGKKKQLTHAVHAFLHPSSRGVDDSTLINCVVRILNQTWIDDGDTCEIRKYVNEEGIMSSFIDVVKDVYTDGKKLEMDNRTYTPYTDPDIANFFSPGIIEYVYNLSSSANISNEKMYTIKKGEVILNKELTADNQIPLIMPKECMECLTLKDFLRKAIADDLQQKPVVKREHNEIISLIKEYYFPICVESIIQSIAFDDNIKSPFVKYSFNLTWNGETEDVSVKIPGRAIGRKWNEKFLMLEIQQWKFPPLKNESKPFKVSFIDTLAIL